MALGALALTLAGCGGGATVSAAPTDGTTAARALPVGSVYLLECAGTPPSDTSLTLTAGIARLVALRHPPPEQALFALVEFPANAFKVDSGTTVQITIRPRPGLYGVDLESDAPFSAGVRITFKYARHYAAPLEAERRPGGEAAFEATLVVAWLREATAFMLASTRGASDNLSAVVKDSGRYVVAGPK